MDGNISQKIREIMGSAVNMTEDERAELTISCRDADYISKVQGAGKIVTDGVDEKYQIMHNGLKVLAGAYGDNWTIRIIKRLHGHHEPQEEKVFYEVLKRVDKGSIMVELGAFWAYYSLWFNAFIEDSYNYCIEPDLSRLQQLGLPRCPLSYLKLL